MSKEDLEYIGTVILLATRGGAITDYDIQKSIKMSKILYKKIFEDSENSIIFR